jgi:hypothetical protein
MAESSIANRDSGEFEPLILRRLSDITPMPTMRDVMRVQLVYGGEWIRVAATRNRTGPKPQGSVSAAGRAPAGRSGTASSARSAGASTASLVHPSVWRISQADHRLAPRRDSPPDLATHRPQGRHHPPGAGDDQERRGPHLSLPGAPGPGHARRAAGRGHGPQPNGRRSASSRGCSIPTGNPSGTSGAPGLPPASRRSVPSAPAKAGQDGRRETPHASVP